MMGPAGKIAGAPYSAEVVTQHVQILGDGNRIEQNTTGSVARDGQGRVRRDEALPALAGGGEAPHLIMIDDPVAQVHWTLDAQTKTATKMPMPAMPPGKAGTTFNLGMPAPPWRWQRERGHFLRRPRTFRQLQFATTIRMARRRRKQDRSRHPDRGRRARARHAHHANDRGRSNG